jgi:HEAT repeat protein
MLWHRRPNIQRLARRRDTRRLADALSYHDYWIDQHARVFDLGASTRRDAALALATVGDDGAPGVDVGAALIGALADRSGEVRRAAAIALGVRSEDRAVVPLLDGVLGSTRPLDDRFQSAALAALLRMNASVVARTVVEFVVGRSCDVEQAREVLRAVLAAGTPEALRSATDAAGSALVRSGSRAQDRAADVLTWIGADGIPALVTAVQQDDVCVPAIRALGTLRATDCVDVLATHLSDDDPEVRRATAAALGEISDPRAGSLLIEAAQDPDYGVRAAAIAAVQQLGPLATATDVSSASGSRPVLS